MSDEVINTKEWLAIKAPKCPQCGASLLAKSVIPLSPNIDELGAISVTWHHGEKDERVMYLDHDFTIKKVYRIKGAEHPSTE